MLFIGMKRYERTIDNAESVLNHLDFFDSACTTLLTKEELKDIREEQVHITQSKNNLIQKIIGLHDLRGKLKKCESQLKGLIKLFEFEYFTQRGHTKPFDLSLPLSSVVPIYCEILLADRTRRSKTKNDPPAIWNASWEKVLGIFKECKECNLYLLHESIETKKASYALRELCHETRSKMAYLKLELLTRVEPNSILELKIQRRVLKTRPMKHSKLFPVTPILDHRRERLEKELRERP